jgi:hypothetical protein
MSAIADDLSKEYLVQQVAKKLSPELRAEYYRTLRYCHSLPESDELLIVLNAIQLFFSLAIDVPSQIASEGQKIQRFLEPAVQAQEHTVHLFEQYQSQLDQRLAQIPLEIVKHIQPELIAANVTESLRQEFAQTTIPETAKLLKTELADMHTSVGKFKKSAQAISDCHYGAAADARRVTEDLRREAEGLSHKHWLWAYRLAGLALLIGMALGALTFWWVAAPMDPHGPTVTPQVEPAPSMVPQVPQRPRPKSPP